ncbi:hypothetical protein G6F62_008685 [Rhizopus arrhizus]|nr:hypothetical protein G6F62_008685 [Rhizopus arrhizus]KAG1412473.1 hypothetical protein G6F58_007996 [Rhizopus delemar]
MVLICLLTKLASSRLVQKESQQLSPKTNQSDSDEDNQIATQGFDRFRENSVCSTEENPNDSIAEYCAESLYSYSFTPLSRVNKATKIKRHLLNRGMDYMQRIRWNTTEREPSRRFSQPDMGVLDLPNEWTSSDIKVSPSVNDLVRHHLTAQTKQETDEDGFSVGRRQTIEAFQGLQPPVREVPASTRSTQFNHALHTPSRFLPQNQAILTTDADATILLFNDMASLCFGIDKSFVGQSVLKALDDPIRKQIKGILKRRRQLDPVTREKGVVLVCGVVVSINKMTGEKTAASLWLKEKVTDEGKTIYIWIFEEIYETSLVVRLDHQGTLLEVNSTIKDLFGYEAHQVTGQSITQLIPGLSTAGTPDLQQIDKIKFYGALSSKGVSFPIMINSSSEANDVFKIVSLPSVAGLITVHHKTGKIQSINPVPAKYLFGYPTEMLVEKLDIGQIIPQFSEIVTGLLECNLLQSSCTVNNHACRWVISDLFSADSYQSMNTQESLKSIERRPSVNAKGQALPVIHAVHRDGSSFEIQVQLRLIESEKEDLISVWVTYDRIQAMKCVARKKKQSLTTTPALPTLKDSSAEYPLSTKKRPPIRTYGISSFGNVDRKKAIFPRDEANQSRESLESLHSNGYTSSEESLPLVKKHSPIDNYVILSTLGEGAYGTAKLAYRKDDPTMTKVVIKFIAKSRIVVDSWIRDRKLGLIPLEIHILKKLKDYPQPNCCSIETYFEDEDTYFAIMKLYGERSMDLFDYIELNEHIDESEIKNIFLQIAKAVEHIHQLHIVHRDIKDENVLLDENGCVQLIDFGSATYFREGRKFDTFGGTLDYCAPEILKGMPYEGPPQDIWSLGTLLYTMIYRENPFYNVDEILEHDLRVPYVLSEESLDLVRHMLNRDVKERYTINQVLAHSWLQV